MTLILSLVTYNKIVQVSDRRLTWENGDIADDNANKAICVSCLDSCFSIAYTGLAKIGKLLQKTDEWLVEFLMSIDAPGKIFLFISYSLNSILNSILKETPVDLKSKILTFVLAGYMEGYPFVVSISNNQPSDMKFMNQGILSKKLNDLFIHGRKQAVDKTILQYIKKLKRTRFFQLCDGEDISNKLVFLIRASTKSPLAENRIGRDCMSIEISKKPEYPSNYNLIAKYHPDKESPIEYGPHFITQIGAFSNIEFSSD